MLKPFFLALVISVVSWANGLICTAKMCIHSALRLTIELGCLVFYKLSMIMGDV